ncbi:MAG: hypothetical protein HND48_17360 [Chloroflexi bacterium]|nr:hypothetical protein [Chloroflexota bacterium]
MTRRATLIVMLLLAVLLALPAAAADRNNLSLTVTCTGFTTQGGSITLDRDNTGAGRERFSFVASDGNGTTIYSGPVESFYVGAHHQLSDRPCDHVHRDAGRQPDCRVAGERGRQWGRRAGRFHRRRHMPEPADWHSRRIDPDRPSVAERAGQRAAAQRCQQR